MDKHVFLNQWSAWIVHLPACYFVEIQYITNEHNGQFLFFEGTVHLFKEHYVDNERFIRGGDVRSSCPVLSRDVCRRNATQGVG